MPTAVQPDTKGAKSIARKPTAPRAPIKTNAAPGSSHVQRATPNGTVKAPRKAAAPVRNKAASIAEESPVTGVTSAYGIMASRIANRVAEMAESITLVERPKPKEPEPLLPEEKKRPRKLELRLETGPEALAFSAPFLDNTLQKMLQLQNRMLKSATELSKTKGVGEKVIQEQAAQVAELSRIIALICAEKARQGA